MSDIADNVPESISIVQRGNLEALEKSLRKIWRMGQNIPLCWNADEHGLLIIFVPHYFLGDYCPFDGAQSDRGRDTEAFFRDLLSWQRRKKREELLAISERLDVSPTYIRLNTALTEERQVVEAVEQLIKRYGLDYVESRAVLLFDIVKFSLYTPFEQVSQLNSLSYSLNLACDKLLARGIEINVARTPSGHGYYIWNRDLGSNANRDLFLLMLLVVAANAVARAESKGRTVPVVRTGYHIGGHCEFYQTEGVNPSVFSYIVGEVTIELASMLNVAQPNQILIGDFCCETPGWKTPADSHTAIRVAPTMSTPVFVSACNRGLAALQGTRLSGKSVNTLACHLTGKVDPGKKSGPRRFRIVDEYGLSHRAYNLQIDIELEGESLSLGTKADDLPHAAPAADAGKLESGGAPPVTAEFIEDLLAILKKKHGENPLDED